MSAPRSSKTPSLSRTINTILLDSFANDSNQPADVLIEKLVADLKNILAKYLPEIEKKAAKGKESEASRSPTEEKEEKILNDPGTLEDFWNSICSISLFAKERLSKNQFYTKFENLKRQNTEEYKALVNSKKKPEKILVYLTLLTLAKHIKNIIDLLQFEEVVKIALKIALSNPNLKSSMFHSDTFTPILKELANFFTKKELQLDKLRAIYVIALQVVCKNMPLHKGLQFGHAKFFLEQHNPRLDNLLNKLKKDEALRRKESRPLPIFPKYNECGMSWCQCLSFFDTYESMQFDNLFPLLAESCKSQIESQIKHDFPTIETLNREEQFRALAATDLKDLSTGLIPVIRSYLKAPNDPKSPATSPSEEGSASRRPK